MSSDPTNPQALVEEAKRRATAYLAFPEADRDSELRRLKQENPVLHALVRHQIQEIRDAAHRPRPQGDGSWIRRLLFGIDPDTLPPGDNLGWGI